MTLPVRPIEPPGGSPSRSASAASAKGYRRLCLWVAAVLMIWGAASGSADTGGGPRSLPAGVAAGLSAWLDMVETGADSSFDPVKASAVVEFVSSSKEAAARSTALQMEALQPLAYYEFDLRHGFDRILGYAYHSGIPPHILSLSSIRYSYWKGGDGHPRPVPPLVVPEVGAAQPSVRHGVEHEVITPDLFSGAYYAYDLQRSLVVYRHEGRRVLISLSRQKDTSSVGRRGFVLGRDADWNYLYTPQEGLTLPGLGWVDSFMYGSFAAIVYVETGPHTLRCGVFKWLQAGWKGLNMVKAEHILAGLERYAGTAQDILDNPRMPDPALIREVVARIEGLSEDQLRRGSRAYLMALHRVHGEAESFPRKWFDEAVVNGTYIASLRRPEMEAAFFLEYMKVALGKASLLGFEELLAAAYGGQAVPEVIAWRGREALAPASQGRAP
jgi:hypothetical protein